MPLSAPMLEWSNHSTRIATCSHHLLNRPVEIPAIDLKLPLPFEAASATTD
jgi:hypothetical protein